MHSIRWCLLLLLYHGLSLCLFLGLNHEPCKNGWTDRDAIGMWWGPRNHVLGRDANPPMWRGTFGGPVVILGHSRSCRSRCSQSYSLGGSSNVAYCCQYCSNWLLLLLGTYFARDASYAHEYTDTRLTEATSAINITGGLQETAAAGGSGVSEVKKAEDDDENRALPSAIDETDASGTSGSSRLLRVMIAARVYVGRYAAGRRTYRKPPPLHPAQPYSATFDSCVNYPDDPTLFVVFDSSQCYPEHFITYHCRPQQLHA